LIDNAIKLGLSSGHVWIDGAQLGIDAVISIKDDGTGIPPGQQEPSFKLFEHIDRSKPGQ
jgi:signal transduction histidine kinase